MDRTLDALLFRRELGAGTPRAYASALGSSASLVKRLTLRYELEGHIGSVNTLSYDSSGLLASAGDDCTLKLWSAGGRQLRSFDPVRRFFVLGRLVVVGF